MREGRKDIFRSIGVDIVWGEQETEEEEGEEQVIFKPLADSLPIHLCLGSVPCCSLKTKEALHQHSGKTDTETCCFSGLSPLQLIKGFLANYSVLPKKITELLQIGYVSSGRGEQGR